MHMTIPYSRGNVAYPRDSDAVVKLPFDIDARFRTHLRRGCNRSGFLSRPEAKLHLLPDLLGGGYDNPKKMQIQVCFKFNIVRLTNTPRRCTVAQKGKHVQGWIDGLHHDTTFVPYSWWSLPG